MSKILDEVLGASKKYAGSFGDKSKLQIPPARQFAILTCMDARLDPAKYAALEIPAATAAGKAATTKAKESR